MTTKKPLPSFEKPPVKEVVFSIQFKSIDLKSVSVGEFWNQMRSEFPNVEDAQPFADNPETAEPSFQFIPMPPLRRVRMSNADKSLSIQLQQTRFITNWVKATDSTPYPRFPLVFRSFREHYEKFVSFLKSANIHEPTATHFELTYVNEFLSQDETPMDLLEKTFNFCNWSKFEHEFLTEPEIVNYAWQFPMPNASGKLVLSLSPAQRADGAKVMLFVLRCLTQGGEGFSIDEWFECAHECIVRAFAELTTEDAHRLWVRNDQDESETR